MVHVVLSPSTAADATLARASDDWKASLLPATSCVLTLAVTKTHKLNVFCENYICVLLLCISEISCRSCKFTKTNKTKTNKQTNKITTYYRQYIYFTKKFSLHVHVKITLDINSFNLITMCVRADLIFYTKEFNF